MLQNVRIVAFTVSELFRENQHGGGGAKITHPPPPPPHTQIRIKKHNQFESLVLASYCYYGDNI